MRSFLFILLFFYVKLAAQHSNTTNHLSLFFNEPEPLRKANIKNIRCIFKDSRELIWIGTENGLFRFDGTNIIDERHKPGDTTSVPNNTILTLTEDKSGNIWMGTLGGVACMNPYDFKCKVYRQELNNLDENFDNKVIATSSGQVWSGNSHGLFLLDKKLHKFKKVWNDVVPRKQGSNYVTAIAQWTKDTIVVGTFSDIVLINTNNYGFKRISPVKKGILVTALLVDSQHRLWAGTWSEGCIIGDRSLSKFQFYKWEKDLPSGVDNIVSGLTETVSNGEHNVWLSSSNTVHKFSVASNYTVDLRNVSSYKETKNNTLQNNVSFGYLMADENRVWVGGSTVRVFPADVNLFKVLPVQLHGTVLSIQPVKLNVQKFLALSLWHGSEGLVLIHPQTNAVRTIKTVDAKDQFGTNVSGIAKDTFNRIWLSSLAGVFILDDKLRIIKNLTKSLLGANAISAKKTNDILLNNDTAWVACYKKGIDLYDMQFHKLKHFSSSNSCGLKDDLIERIYKDKLNRIWICGNSFFYKYQPNTATFKLYDLSEEHTVYSPRDVTELADGNLVIASETGLIYFNTNNETYYRITSGLLQKEENIVSVCAGVKGDVWYLTENHLVNYQPQTKSFMLFGDEDGLDVSALQCVRTFDGRNFYLADNGKLLQFNPEYWKKNSSAMHVLIHAIQVNDSTVQSSKPVTELHLNYDQNKIFIEFDGVTYTKPQQNLYMYKLDGLDQSWISSNKNFASYSNLPPGSYTFRVKASNYTGIWSKEYAINIKIKPPFWKTWWFISLAVLSIGLLFFLIVRYISQRNLIEKILRLEKEQAIEKERNRIARDMHDSLGSGLTKIAILSEVAKTQIQKKEEAFVQLEKISNSSRELVDSLQDIIWVLNPQNDSLDNLAAYIREYALKFFDGTDIVVHFNYPSSIPAFKLSEEERQNIFLVIKEALNNIAKHAVGNNVTVSLCILKNELHVAIEDDGKGFEHSSLRHFANGLSNMKTRMEQINGSFKIESSSKGTKATLSLFI